MTDPVRIVVVGAGRFGTLHARVWIEAGATVAGNVDVVASRAAAVAADHPAVSGTDLAAVIYTSHSYAVGLTRD